MLLKLESFVDESFQLKISSTVAELIDPDWGVEVNSGIGLSYRPARLHGLTGRYDNPMPELTILQSLIYEFGYSTTKYALDIHVVIGHALSMLVFYYLQLNV
jgi:hypothetical protein